MVKRSLITVLGLFALWNSPGNCALQGPFNAVELVASDGMESQNLGYAVAVSGNTVAVGAPSINEGEELEAPGIVYVYVFENSLEDASRWLETAKLLPDKSNPGDCFGCSVAIDGDIIVVGGLMKSTSAIDTAYVFRRPDNGWQGILQPIARLELPPSPPASGYGADVAVSGGVIVVGDPGADPAALEQNFRGAAFVFIEPAEGWRGTIKPQATLLAQTRREHDNFGTSVAVEGTTIVVGATGALTPRGKSNPFQTADRGPGGVFVFTEPPGGWEGTTYPNSMLRRSDGEPYDFFGRGVATDGDDTIAVTDGSGRAMIFERPGESWEGTLKETASLAATDGAPLRPAISIDDETIVAQGFGATGEAVYVYLEPAGGWTGVVPEYTKLTSPIREALHAFGEAVDISFRTIVVGAYETTIGKNQRQGAAYVYKLANSTCEPSPTTACLGDGRFRVEADWNTTASQGRARARLLTGDTTAFSFFQPANLELAVKILDGCRLNDRFWVFAGGLTDVGVELRVTDTLTNESRTYRSPLDEPFQPLQDLNAFATCKVDAGAEKGQNQLTVASGESGLLKRPAPQAVLNGCEDESAGICLNDGRFHLNVSWETSSGKGGIGAGTIVTEDSGAFTFFGEANIEMLVKVLDTCNTFGRYWVFVGGLTDVATELVVTDTVTSASRTYRNPQNTPFRPVLDTTAFTCGG